MSESNSNNQATIPTTVGELPSYTDLGNRTQFESLVNLNAPPTQQAQVNQMAFSQSIPSPYSFPGRPVYFKPGANQPVYFPYQTQQYQPQQQQQQHQQQFMPPVVQNVPYQFQAAREAYLKESYPTGYVVFHNVFLILLSLVIVTIQTLLIFNNAYTSFIGGGCWSGAWLLFTAIFSLATLGCKSNCTIISSVVFQLLGLVFVFIGCVVTSTLNVSGDMPCWDGYCDKSLVWQLLYSLTAMGVCIMVLCLIFSVFILVRFVRARRQHDAFVNMQHYNFYAQQQQHQQAQGFANPNYGWNQQARFNNQTQRLA